jgi:hypothetical protein
MLSLIVAKRRRMRQSFEGLNLEGIFFCDRCCGGLTRSQTEGPSGGPVGQALIHQAGWSVMPSGLLCRLVEGGEEQRTRDADQLLGLNRLQAEEDIHGFVLGLCFGQAAENEDWHR